MFEAVQWLEDRLSLDHEFAMRRKENGEIVAYMDYPGRFAGRISMVGETFVDALIGLREIVDREEKE